MPWLVGVFGLGMLGAAAFRADPSDGFPPGTPAGMPDEVSTSGALHLVFGSLGFLGLIIAAIVTGVWWIRRGRTGPGRLSLAAGIAFLAANLSGAVLADHPRVYVVVLTAGILVGFAWLTGFSAVTYRAVPSGGSGSAPASDPAPAPEGAR